jgi:hypothetical protein
MILFPAFIMLISLPLLVLAFLSFDAAIVILRNRHKDAWIADGMPFTAYRDREQFTHGFSSVLATNRCLFMWLFKTPTWAVNDEEALSQLHRLRLFVGLWNFVAMPLFAISMVVVIAWS